MALAENRRIARRLQEVAALLEEQGANPFRVGAYRRGAETVSRMEESVSGLLDREGLPGLLELRGIGESLARSIRELVLTGRLPMLDRLRGASDPVALIATVPGLGAVLAERLHHDLGIDTLEELETAAHDGRLAEIEGLGGKRIAGIIDSLEARLGRVRRAAPRRGPARPARHEAPVPEILDVDRQYREAAARGTLRRIAPRRFNPSGETCALPYPP